LRRKTNGSPEGKRKKGKRVAKGSVRRVWRRRREREEIGRNRRKSPGNRNERE
jgi:hypothetical protein